MMTQRLNWFRSLFILGISSCLLGNALGQAQPPSAKIKTATGPFRYVIINDEIENSRDGRLTSRHVEILLDKKSFSEENLRRLFWLISRRFPEPITLFVDVYTSLDQAPTPEERDEGGRSNQAEEPSKDFLWAMYVRNHNSEFFRYSPIANRTANKQVQLNFP